MEKGLWGEKRGNQAPHAATITSREAASAPGTWGAGLPMRWSSKKE